ASGGSLEDLGGILRPAQPPRSPGQPARHGGANQEATRPRRGRMMERDRLIRDPDGKPIGRLMSSERGWRALAFPGCTSSEIDLVMDAVDPVFTRMMEARRAYR